MNAEQLAAIPGLQYVQMPVPFLAWWPGMDPFALVLVEHWPGYVDTVTHWLKQSHIDEAELIREGWATQGNTGCCGGDRFRNFPHGDVQAPFSDRFPELFRLHRIRVSLRQRSFGVLKSI